MSKNVTAPRRWQYRPDTEPTQLAYVTQPEIDLLVKENIHGSMDGKPNRGPKGIISLDSGGDWSSPPWNPPQVSAAPPGATGGGGTVGPEEVQWISTPQASDVYYGSGGQGTTNVNITDPTAANYNQELAQEAMETQAAEAETVAAAAAAAQPKVAKPWYQFGPGIQGLPAYSQNVYKNLINQYLLGKPSGLWESLKGMKGGIFGAGMNAIFGKEDLWREDGTPTLEGLEKMIGSENIQSLKKYNPEMYYDFTNPQTTGGLEDLANLPTTGDDAVDDPDLRQKIFDARQELDRKKRRHDGGGQGIADLSPAAQLAATTPEEVAATPEEVPAATTTAMTTPTPFDYSQWPQFTSAYPGYNQYPGPNYVNQGLGQGPNFDYWNQIANAYPGMGNYG